jgi:acyl-[acyl carrier protein]--UDP-N-acetylglucosamine O-acyltransferase
MDDNTSFDSSKESVTRFSCDVVVCNSLSAWYRYLSIFRLRRKACFSDPLQLTSISQAYKRVLKYREENVNGIKDDKRRIKENMKKLKEKLIQRINQVDNELTNKLDILVQEKTKFQQDEISKVLEVTEEVVIKSKTTLGTTFIIFSLTQISKIGN